MALPSWYRVRTPSGTQRGAFVRGRLASERSAGAPAVRGAIGASAVTAEQGSLSAKIVLTRTPEEGSALAIWFVAERNPALSAGGAQMS